MTPRLLRAIPFLALGACADATAPIPRFVATVTADTVAASVATYASVEWMRFVVPVTIHNTGVRPIALEYCASMVERVSGRSSTTAWSPICTAIVRLSGANAIPPGESRAVSFEIGAALSGPAAPQWQVPTVEGTYRMNLLVFQVPGDSGMRVPGAGVRGASDTFVLRRN